MISYAVFCLKKKKKKNNKIIFFIFFFFFFLMIRRPPRSTQSRSSAASDVYKRQVPVDIPLTIVLSLTSPAARSNSSFIPVSYTHLRAHETRHDIVCRLLLEKK